MTSSSPIAPKRKRGEDDPLSSPIHFTLDSSQPDSLEDGDGSPRSKVVHRFLGLALGSGAGVRNDHGDDDDDDDDDDGTMDATRKRQKSDQEMMDAGQVCGPDQAKHLLQAPDLKPHLGSTTDDAPSATDSPSKPPLAPDETETSNFNKSPRRKRAGTPPLKFKNAAPPTGPPEGAETRQDPTADKPKEDTDQVVDPIRAALTWHEDEITVYDPDDADDDGFGVNGIGFKPTPALAQSRAMRRRQQMADYRKREEGEARTKRTQRRRGDEPLLGRPKRKSPARRVHFLDPERQQTAVFAQQGWPYHCYERTRTTPR
ncbi:hypothetical protein E4U41_005855 [Claviceps citrina]|nr:hypothetical protein E4U41_005855 [Claviceps citrina]